MKTIEKLLGISDFTKEEKKDFWYANLFGVVFIIVTFAFMSIMEKNY